MSTYRFHVSGTHCASCKILIEEEIGKMEYVEDARVDLAAETLEVKTRDTRSPVELADALTRAIRPNGYAVHMERPTPNAQEGRGNLNTLWKAIPIGIGTLAAFFALQKSGILDIGIGGTVTPVTSFLIGLVASVSSCLAVVGGLVLSLSAKVAQDEVHPARTFIAFHAARLVSFALLGGALGAVGGAIGVNFTFAALLGIFAAVVMIVLGLHLAGLVKKNFFTLPPRFFESLRGLEHQSIAPIVLGVATFFLPCGFTQSMQVAALGSGSFLSGLSIMFAFSLGTLPVLAFLSFGSASFARGKYAPIFFQSAGVVVLGLGLFTLLSGLASLGVIPPLVMF